MFVFIAHWRYVLLLVSVGAAAAKGSQEDSSTLLQHQKAEQILNFMNRSADPCENFYEYTCGNYGKYVEPYLLQYGMWTVLNNITQTYEDKILAEMHKDIQPDDAEDDKKLKHFFNVCISDATTAIGNDSHKMRLREILREVGKMPLLEGEEWQEDDFNWMKVVAAIKHETDRSILFNAIIMPDFSNNTQNSVALLQPTFFLGQRDSYTGANSNQSLLVFHDFFVSDLVKILQLDKDAVVEATWEVILFEVALAEAMQDNELTPPSELYALIDMDELEQKYYGIFDPRTFIKAALDLEPTRIMIQPKYLQNALNVIQRTPKRVVANYIFYMYMLDFMFEPFVVTKMEKPLACLDVTRTYFVENLQNMAYRKFFTDNDKKLVKVLEQEMKLAFDEILKSPKLKWIDNGGTLESALEKLRAMRLSIDTFEAIDFNKSLSELNLSDHDAFENLRAALRWRGQQARLKINQPPQFKIPPLHSPSYTIEENVIHIPVSHLQTDNPWSASYPFAVNFGTLGFFIAHEMVHGFDDTGLYFDGSGSSRDWWHPSSLAQHRERLNCFAKQYQNYTFQGRSLPKLPAQTENIADNGGLHIAYEAYQRWLKENAFDENRLMDTMPSLNFTNNQLFFISIGQGMCVGINNKEETTSVDVHLPAEVRIIGSLSNFEQFAEAFNCPKGSQMNPLKKCKMF